MIRSAAILAVLAVFAIGCAHAPRAEVVWPSPPDKPRIRFVMAFAQTEDLNVESRWDDVRRKLVGSSPEAALSSPTGLAISDDGLRLYIADYSGGQLMRADFLARNLAPFAEEELKGRPFSVALDGDENAYVTESYGTPGVAVFSRAGKLLRRFGAAEKLERPTGIAIDRKQGLVYVVDSSSQASDNHRVLVYDLAGKVQRQLGAEIGKPTRGDADGQFLFPSHIAVRPSDGQVFVGDTMNFRIQVFDAKGRFLRRLGEAGDGPGTFTRIKGIAFDKYENLYVADGQHSVVQMFNRDGQMLMFFGGFAPKLLEYFDVPGGVAIHGPSNRIYVCNEHVARINVYELINTTAEDAQQKPAAEAAPPSP